MRSADHHQSCCPFVGFREIARTPRAGKAAGHHQRSAQQAAGRWWLESVVTGWRMETSGWNSAGSEKRRLRHRVYHLRTTTSGDSPSGCPTAAGSRVAGKQSEQDGRLLAILLIE